MQQIILLVFCVCKKLFCFLLDQTISLFFFIFLLVHKCQPKLCNQFNFGFLLVQIIVFLFLLAETIRFLFLIGANNSIPVSYWWKQFNSCFLLVETIRFLFLIGSTFKFLFLTDANIRIKVHFCFCRCKI